jgi:uncharacterized membrane protein
MHDKVIVIGSKLWLLSGIILPIAFLFINIFNKNRFIKFIFAELLIFICYNNMLAYSFFITAPSFYVGMTSEIPLSTAVFLPVALACFLYGAMIKNIPYKSKFGIRSKLTTTTEFIWNQSHYYGSYYYRLTGMILFVISVIFSFFHLPLIELIIFIIGLIIPRIITELTARQMSNKYQDMKAKHDHLTNKKKAKPE